MKKLIVFSLFFIGIMYGQSVSFDWAKQITGSQPEFVYGMGRDTSGNIYLAGRFQGTCDFDPGPGVFNMTASSIWWDIFVCKLDVNGNFIWAKKMGSTDSDQPNDLYVDVAGNCYITGYFQGTVDFNPDAGVNNLTSAGVEDLFVLKLNSSGAYVWAKKIGGTAYDSGESIVADATGNVYITGGFSGILDFDPGASTYNLTSSGLSEIFLLKLNSAGNFSFAKQLGGPGYDYGQEIKLDVTGNIYLVGGFTGTADFDPNVGVSNLTSAGDYDLFIAKLDPSANLLFAKRMGGPGTDRCYSIAIGDSGNIYSCGYFNDTADFDPGPGTYPLISSGQSDAHLSKLDPSGNFIWAKKMGGSVGDQGYSIALRNGEIYLTGVYNNTVDFDPGPGFQYCSSLIGYSTVFVTKFQSSGNLSWVKSFAGNSGSSNPRSIDVDAAGNVFTAGGFAGSADMDPGTGTTLFTSPGFQDVFLQKMTPCSNISNSSMVVTSCPGYSFFGVICNVSGTYQKVLTNNAGCDSVITLNLTIVPNTNASINLFICDSQTVNSQTYYAPGTYSQTLTNSNGCDSLLTVNLVNPPPVNSSISLSTCDSSIVNSQTYYISGTYIQPLTTVGGCDSLLTIYLTNLSSANTIQVMACDTAIVNSINYTSSGIYHQTLINSHSCDSNLTVEVNLLHNANTIFVAECETAIVNGITYTSSGIYHQTLINSHSCDSTLTINLSILTSESNTVPVSNCDSVELNGIVYYTSGTYLQTIPTYDGCDSNLTYVVTILQPTTRTINTTSCESYTLNSQTFTSSGTYIQHLTNHAGCDSTITLQLTIHHGSSSTINANGCNSYTLNSQTYTNNGNYTQILANHFDCDSTIHLNLVVDGNTTINQSGNTFTSSLADTYQWINCSAGNSVVAGANGQSYTPATSGSYAVITTENACIDTSVCSPYIIIGIEENYLSDISVYPNPTTDNVQIDLKNIHEEITIDILDVLGQKIFSRKVMNAEIVNLKMPDTTGIYLVIIYSEQDSFVFKIIKR